ncbi:MAG: rhodanese-related sulfurtransferase [Bacteroidales bacterium]|nr:rhodanese-related sulfurtransferase [Bacteroidales bacterium]
MLLHNRINRKELETRLMEEPFKRLTLSFYRYFRLEAPKEFRDNLYQQWSKLGCFGRIYIAHEGINAQMSVPEHSKEAFVSHLFSIKELKDIPLKWAVDDDGKSFYKLTVKIRPKLVADGLPEGSFDITNVGKHLTPLEFHEAIDEPGTLVVDMRNHYESEIGRFEKAICANSDTFGEGILKIAEVLQDHKDKKIMLYCTGGIRCEKASAFLRHVGFNNVNQLYGGIIEYAYVIRHLNLPSKFVGRNFVFDRRLGEDITGSVISHCHQCGQPANTHVNCDNPDCHLLFIQCESCSIKYSKCCSEECRNIACLPENERRLLRKTKQEKYAMSKIFSKGNLLKKNLKPIPLREEKI